MSSKVHFQLLDSTLREGMQSVTPFCNQQGIILSYNDSLEVAEKLVNFGIHYIEVGSPVNSKIGKKLIKNIKRICNTSETKLLIHCRLHHQDISDALDCNPYGLNLYFNLSFSKSNPNLELEENALREIASLKNAHPNMILRFSFEDAFKTSFQTMYHVIKNTSNLFDKYGFPDTTGMASPTEVKLLLNRLKKSFPSLVTEFHFHNDRGLATANALTAIKYGANIIDTTIFGIGERNGIVSLASIIAATYGEADLQDYVKSSFQLSSITELHELTAKALGISQSLSEPIVSTGAFTHSAGVHVNGFKKDQKNYKSIFPEDFGRKTDFCVASSVIGKTNIQLRTQQLGLNISEDDAKQLASGLREKAKINGKLTLDEVDHALKSWISKKV